MTLKWQTKHANFIYRERGGMMETGSGGKEGKEEGISHHHFVEQTLSFSMLDTVTLHETRVTVIEANG